MKLFFLSLPLILIISIFFSGCSDREEENHAKEGYIPYPPKPTPSLSVKEQKKIALKFFSRIEPGGFDAKRGIVVRIGRIIGKKDETMQTDSRLLGGDSGGPLFDFQGKVIAIHSRISQKPDQNFHVPIDCYHANWDFFKNQEISEWTQ